MPLAGTTADPLHFQAMKLSGEEVDLGMPTTEMIQTEEEEEEGEFMHMAASSRGPTIPYKEV